MSLLFPLYLGGLLAVSLPIVFHMIRRTPSGSQPFGSLMFLRNSPPRLVRRKRLEHLALLCLRALVIGLLALAFARPYLRDESRIEAADEEAGRIALLIDTSASMRRPGLWDAALREARAVRDAAAGGVMIFGFDDDLTEVSDPSELEPTWFPTNLGGALVEVAQRLQLGQTEAGLVSRIVLVSDLQQGSDLSELQGYDWPADVELELRGVTGAPGNAGLHPGPRDRDDDGALRVRVSNAADSPLDRFTLQWRSPSTQAVGEALTVFCPPGESRVVRAPERPETGLDLGLVLEGDGAAFDNVLFERPAAPQPGAVLSLGGANEEEQDLDFFLRNVFGGDAEAFVARDAGPVPALVVSGAPAGYGLVVLNPATPGLDGEAEALLEHARAGGVVLVVLGRGDAPPGARDLLANLFAAPGLDLSEGDTDDGAGFALLSEIDFQHPLFAPFADPRYSDFTRIRFWHHRRVEPGTAAELRTLATFDDGDPFLLERRVGSGSLLLATSGWEPADSDLARSTKFAPLLAGMLRLGSASDLTAELLHVGDAVPVVRPAGVPASVGLPDGARVELGPTEELFRGTDLPGLYDLAIGDTIRPFAVYLDPEESRTEPLELDPLARAGVSIAAPTVASATPEGRQRQELGFEIERRQKLWSWLIFAAVAGLLVETAWAGRLARRSDTEANRGS